MELSTKSNFKRVLWSNQLYPDNYQDHTLLHQLLSGQTYLLIQPSFESYSTLVICSLPLSAQLSSIFIFIAVFAHLHLTLIHPQHLIWLTMAIGASGYVVWERALPGREKDRLPALRSASLLIFLLLLLSPVLKTLTLSTASDSIWALTAVLLALNILLGDYRHRPNPNSHLDVSFPSALSLNAAIFASVVLGSRLSSNADVFGLVLFALEWFALFPLMRRDMMRKHPESHLRPVVLNVSLALIALLILYPISSSTALIYLTLVPLGSTFVLPAIYCGLQHYKRDLRGPWDCAVPRIS
ncbi:hypothetical protein CROQUDRAFT_49381 [Cronartium quercuum f. sp. fusiforme G11]|uniref:Phosphatidylinositol N-acetylglucosaminyltransferase n=1 Tax=Cronartium quercuum f. sp. fusiforme G11 TaxID=708437 RepID=A0A9P6NFF6_9BASI|nr:hypothetical protein CROQUDRAFT_49381 [Cronartium quercuum f. sp. fusiforme G11]